MNKTRIESEFNDLNSGDILNWLWLKASRLNAMDLLFILRLMQLFSIGDFKDSEKKIINVLSDDNEVLRSNSFCMQDFPE